MVASLSVVTTGGGVSNQRLLKTTAGGGGKIFKSDVGLSAERKEPLCCVYFFEICGN